jgi:hypothetical protein
MTFENQARVDTKPSETRGGLIFLQKKDTSIDDHIETNTSPRDNPNVNRKKGSTKKPTIHNQPQSVTQSSRGLTNVTRTLYDPNAPTPKTPPIAVVQPITTVKSVPIATVPPMQTNTAPVQEFYQQ